MSEQESLCRQIDTYDCLSAKECVLIRDQVNDDTESQPDVCEGEPREEQGEGVVLFRELGWSHSKYKMTTYQALDVEKEHPNETMA